MINVIKRCCRRLQKLAIFDIFCKNRRMFSNFTISWFIYHIFAINVIICLTLQYLPYFFSNLVIFATIAILLPFFPHIGIKNENSRDKQYL